MTVPIPQLYDLEERDYQRILGVFVLVKDLVTSSELTVAIDGKKLAGDLEVDFQAIDSRIDLRPGTKEMDVGFMNGPECEEEISCAEK